MLEQHPPHVRHRIALVITIGVAVILIILMVIIYTHKAPKDNGTGSTLSTFYNTILRTGQSDKSAN